MLHFSEGTTLVYCDLWDCKYIKEHRLYYGKARIERGEKYINVCGKKYVNLVVVGGASKFHDIPPVVCQYYEKETGEYIPNGKYTIPVEQLGFSVRTMNCLRRGGIYTVGDLMSKNDHDLQALRNFGVVCLKEVHHALGK